MEEDQEQQGFPQILDDDVEVIYESDMIKHQSSALIGVAGGMTAYFGKDFFPEGSAAYSLGWAIVVGSAVYAVVQLNKYFEKATDFNAFATIQKIAIAAIKAQQAKQQQQRQAKEEEQGYAQADV